jgi:UDP-N-acetylglucosamine 2-epimerase (non-hydrolysing)
MNKILIVYGTRPEEIKLYPVWKKLKCPTIQVLQSPDLPTDLIKPNHRIVEGALEGAMSMIDYDYVMVQGDTRTAFRAALIAYQQGKKVIHIEAGLRSWNLYAPHPEEGYRRMIDELSIYKFYPTELAKAHGLTISYPSYDYVVGQTAIDTLLEFAPKPTKTNKIIVTIHRSEANMKEIIKGLKKLISIYKKKFEFIIFSHPNQQGQKLKRELDTTAPLPYKEFVKLLSSCYCVITDSGGLQEEAPALDKPVLVVRDVTERPEGIEVGCSVLVGMTEWKMLNKIRKFLDSEYEYLKMSKAVNPYGDGTASKQIIKILKDV